MKNGKRPTVSQRKFMEKYGLNSADWLVSKDTSEVMELIHRYSDTTRKTIYKEWKQ